MIGLILINYLPFWKSKRTAVTMIALLVILTYPSMSIGNVDITRRFQKLKGQYQSIDTVHVKSQIVIKTYFGRVQDPSSNDATVRDNHYESWANKEGNYRVNSFFYDANGNPTGTWEFAWNGNLFQLFDKRGLLFTYGKKEPEQNPCAPENPLFAQLLFLGRDDDNCRACILKLADVRNVELWERKTNSAKVVTTSAQTPAQMVVEIPGGVMDGRDFVFHVYFGDNPDYLPSKINWVDTAGDIICQTEISAYKAIDLNGKRTYWPKSVRHSGTDAQGNILVELHAEIEVCEINKDLPPDIFTIDFSLAEAVWDEDAKVFVKQEEI